jgi:L-iduronidase
MKKFGFSILLFLTVNLCSQTPVQVNIDFTQTPADFPHYWKSTGFTPAAAVHLPTMQLTLDLLSTQAGKGVVYVRPHYLLNLVGTRGLGTNATEYNWEKLNFVTDYFVQNDLIPFFEIMGHPSIQWDPTEQEYDQYFQGQTSEENRFFANFTDEKQVKEWKSLVKAMALNFINRYGVEEVRTWYFETWNEPNLKHFWPFSLEGFLNYYDACSEGLKEADSSLVFGGPGTAGAPNNDYFKELLNHCESGENFFTGEKGVRIDFISYHIKARVRYMIDNEIDVVKYISTNNPSLSSVPLINNEADPIAGWGRKFFWRPGPWYASFVVHSIDHHNKYLIDNYNINYGLLSNDNGFMGDWYRRTHFARFMENNDDQVSRNEKFYLIKKPVYSVMGLLSMMGNQRFSENLDNKDKHYGIIPTRNENGDIILALYNSPLIEITYNRPVSKEMEYVDSLLYSASDVLFKLNMRGIEPGNYKLIHYRMDEENTNPFAEWIKMGSPELPSMNEYLKIAAKQEPQILGVPTTVEILTTETEIEIDLPAASVSFVLLLKENKNLPAPPANLSYKEYKGLNGEKMILLRWEDLQNKNVLSYDVHYRTNPNEEYSKINNSYLRDRSFIHLLPSDSTGGEYRVKVIDFWGRESNFSPVLNL